jgi:restriction endonuclease S subunit
MENLAQLILATQKLDNVLTPTTAPLLNVTLMLIALLGDKQINSLLNACYQFATKTKVLANLFLIFHLAAHVLANNRLIVHQLNSVPFAILTQDNVSLTNVNIMATA